jgi:hypothetical protein
MLDALTVQTAAETANSLTIIYTIMLAFLLSVVLAVIYQKTFRGLSYSRNYVQAIVLISIISAVIIQSVGDSLARGIGIMAAMAIIRFRTNLKDPRDTLFLFASLAAGISCGAYAFNVAIIGTAGFALAAIVLYFSPLGPTNYYDGMLRFNVATDNQERDDMEKTIHQYCKAFSLVTLRELEQGNKMDYAYHIKLRKGKSYESFLADMKKISSLKGLSLMMQEATVDL